MGVARTDRDDFAGVAFPFACSGPGAKNKQGRPTMSETARPMAMACTPATAAPAGSFSPMRRATMAVVERLYLARLAHEAKHQRSATTP